MKSSNIKNAVIYARYSSSAQSEQSIEGQLRVINEYAQKEGFNIINTYIDRAMTGRNDDRPDFLKMIKDSENKQFQYVIVYKLDRFSRNRYDSAVHKRTLRNNGVKVISATELILDTPEGIILESMIEGLSEYYSAELAQEKNLTQSELAEKLNISDRAISKWENGVCMPEATNLIELSKILDVTINDLFSGEIVDMKENEKKLEEHLIEMTKLKEQKDKALLSVEILLGVVGMIILLSCCFVAAYVEMEEYLRIIIILAGVIVMLPMLIVALRIEQTAGYYECPHCKEKYIPTFNSVLWAMHFGRTRYLKCPKCNKRGWQKKVISK